MTLGFAVAVVGRDATVDVALRTVRKRGTVSVIGGQQSRRLPKSEAAQAYRLFEAREAGALKMVLAPG